MKYTRNWQFGHLIILAISINSCDIKREALGADNEIRVICSSIDEQIIGDFLDSVFSDTIYTPEPEPTYKLKYSPPESYNDLKRQAYIVVGAVGQNESNSGVRLMRKLLSAEQYNSMRTNDPVLLAKDLYARHQLFMIINAQDGNQLSAALPSKKELIRSQFERQFKDRQSRFLFENHRRNDLEENLSNIYDWSIKIPWGWEVIRNSPDSNFVWLGRELPFQWVAIHWQNGDVMTDELIVGEQMWNFPKTYYGNIRFHDYKFSIEKMYFNHYQSWECTGIWESSDDISAKGGPFRSYLFYDATTDRTFHINTIVHHPGRDKSIFLRQLELIAKTFSIKS